MYCIVNYANEYRIFKVLIDTGSLLAATSWHQCQLAAVKEMRVQADNLGFGK